MDKDGHIYRMTEEEYVLARDGLREAPVDPARISGVGVRGMTEARVAELREDVARLDGYLRGRADSDAPKRGQGANSDLAG